MARCFWAVPSRCSWRPTATAHGLIGPIDYDALDEAPIRQQIRDHPLVTDPEAWRRERPFRVAVIEQCTYDGTIYNAETILGADRPPVRLYPVRRGLGGLHEVPSAVRGPLRHGAEGARTPNSPGIIATQSTHKQLASFCQASQIHVKDATSTVSVRRVEHRRFNEMFLMHASTSPFYPLFASLDVGAQMMKGTIGRGAVGRHDPARHRAAQEAARDPPGVRREGARSARHWFFDPFVPDTCGSPATATAGRTGDAVGGRADRRSGLRPGYWEAHARCGWHGFAHVGRALRDHRPEQADPADAGFRPDHRRLQRISASLPRWLPSICARTGSCRKRTTSTASCSC